MSFEVINTVLGIVVLVMFVIIFVVVLKIWNFQQEILRSGGYPTLVNSRAKRDATSILEGRTPWDYEIDEIIEILSRYPDDPEAADLAQRLIAQKNQLERNRGESTG